LKDGGLAAIALVVIGLMLSVLAHEGAHAIAGRLLGLPVGPIRLHGDGGDVLVAEDNNRSAATQAMLFAGPAANLILGVLLLLLLQLDAAATPGLTRLEPIMTTPDGLTHFRIRPPPERPASSLAGTVLMWLGLANLWLAFYNLLPIHRHDGWQILQIRSEARQLRRACEEWEAEKRRHDSGRG
jgi:stage IV sporulation protein FB